ncbi:MAG: FKBP-type peptidyl-prolyl cis-trans isomerase [Saprospiraceae bacterium]|nr:FKBP-type peptidyl-prolyl cis-trans isomerase [Saprospiraceae bacterium]MBK8632037.1 FKBP-type peptidyl-prolyl cis-trans isomerase [Saprospiraceae bacterium]
MRILVVAFLALTLFASCSKDEAQEIADYISEKNLTGFTATPEGVYIKIDNPGSDKRPNLGSLLTVHYRGKLTDGSQFDSSYDRGEAATFPLTGTIQGWQIGLPKFGIGGKGTLIIPPSLGYGKNGSGSSIPGDAILIFDIELINFQ